MPTSKQILFGSIFISALFTTAPAQELTGSSVQTSSLTITAAHDGERARMGASSSIATTRSEFYARTAVKYFEQKLRGGNVFLRQPNGQVERLAADSVQPLGAGPATPGNLTKWQGGVGSLTNSVIYEVANHIGIGTIAPWELLTIDSPVATNNDLGLLVGGTLHAVWGIAGKPDGLINGSNLGDSAFRSSKNILFSTNWGGSAQLFLKNGGNVGIGTANPSFFLDILGNGAGAGNGIQLENSGTTDGDDAQIIFKTKLSRVFSMGLDRTNGMFTLTPNNAKLGGAGSVVINALNGNVGIGTSNPTTPLVVIGSPVGGTITAANSSASNAVGVVGTTTSLSGTNFGVAGETSSPDGAGVLAMGSGVNGTALQILNGAIKVSGAGQGTSTSVFIHVTQPTNISGDRTTIDHPMTNGQPKVILIITLNSSVDGVTNPHPIAVNYNLSSNKWEIFNQDGALMPSDAGFNVLIIKP